MYQTADRLWELWQSCIYQFMLVGDKTKTSAKSLNIILSFTQWTEWMTFSY